jgi:hypothetical protein
MKVWLYDDMEYLEQVHNSIYHERASTVAWVISFAMRSCEDDDKIECYTEFLNLLFKEFHYELRFYFVQLFPVFYFIYF